MENYYIVFSSITQATRVKNNFSSIKGNLRIIHAPTAISNGGCSYAITASKQTIQQILTFCAKHGINYSGIYDKDMKAVQL